MGKIALAKKYFLRKVVDKDPESVSEDSPSPIVEEEEYKKMKCYKWTFYGISRTKARYSPCLARSKATGKGIKETRTAFLLNPVNSSPILAAIKYLLPHEVREANAFDDPIIVNKIIK